MFRLLPVTLVGVLSLLPDPVLAQEVPVAEVAGQPLGANVRRLVSALEFLGDPLPAPLVTELEAAARSRDAAALQRLLDPRVLLAVSINPELRVKVVRGPATALVQQAGFRPVLIKVVNRGATTQALDIGSPQAGPVYAGESEPILGRQAQTELKSGAPNARTDRFLQVEMFRAPPMTPRLSGLEVEYLLALVSSSESGRREATITFAVGAGTQDLGFRGETPVLFDIRPAIPVRLAIHDDNGAPTVASLLVRDTHQRVHPPQAKRLAPDFFFQPQVYRQHGDILRLPPGQFAVAASRGPEYRIVRQQFTVDTTGEAALTVRLARWIHPMDFGFYCGDHHIHGAGCSHYSSPTQGVTPEDMFRQVKGEGLNVGCVLTWGPCFDFQRRYFAPTAATVSEPLTVLKYDLEISGFGSAALGHVCLLNLQNQTYPGSEGTSVKGWPTWTVPVMRWAREQGGVTGYPHSAMHVVPSAAASRLLQQYDTDSDQQLTAQEAARALLPMPFGRIDRDGNSRLNQAELTAAMEVAADQIPNLAPPGMTGAGAMEIFVSAAEGVCDFISAMDTARIPEWNTWYHLMNCGLPVKLSGETDFPCMSSRRVGQGRVYVQLGKVDQVDFSDWCEGLAAGRSYVCDGYAHALEFAVNGQRPGFENVNLPQPGRVQVSAKVAFAAEVPRAVAYGFADPPAGRRMVGDTVNLHVPRTEEMVKGGQRTVELIVNGQVVASQEVPADGAIHDLAFDVAIEASSWVALRQFPQLHTNPVSVLVADQPIRASADSARWCREAIDLLWENRRRFIAAQERPAARAAYDRAQALYRRIEAESRTAP